MTPMANGDGLKEPGIIVSNKVYDFLRAFAMVISPSASAMYLGLSLTLGFPHVMVTVIFTSLVTAVLGVFLIITSRVYHESDLRYDGKMMVSENEEGELLYSLELNDDPEPLRLKSRIVFKVVTDQSRQVG